uniref:Uncharacterized protein n=1 Tax=Triticum urartu TaxID=4572 RepID=A0A8R7NYA4_TRIUA
GGHRRHHRRPAQGHLRPVAQHPHLQAPLSLNSEFARLAAWTWMAKQKAFVANNNL